MTGKIVAGAAAVAVLAVLGWWWSDGATGDGDEGKAADVPVEQAAEPPASEHAADASGTVAGGAARERVHVAPEPDDAAADGGESATDTAGSSSGTAESTAGAAPAAPEQPSVATRLDERPVTFEVQDGTLREVLGRIAWQADIPVDVDLDSVAALDKRTAMNIQGGAARDALTFATMVANLEMTVREDRVVLHAPGLEWDDGRAVRRVEPVADPEPAVPVRVKGRVVGPDGEAVAGARVLGFPQVVTADGDGAFEIDVPPKDYRLQASAPGFVATDWKRTPIDEGAGEQEVVVAFTDVAARLDVRVTTLGQQALPGAIVRVLRHDTPVESAATDADGVARIRETPEGRVTVKVTAKGHAPAERSVIGTAGETLDVALTLEPRKLSERLRTERTSFELDHKPLSQLPGTLFGLWDVTVRLDRYVPHDAAAKTVSLTVSDDTLEGALRALCQASGTTFRVDDEAEIVWISVER